MEKLHELKLEKSENEAIYMQSSLHIYEDEWNKLYKNSDLAVLRNDALVGNLRASRFRSLCWFLLLDVLTNNSSKWIERLTNLRSSYDKIKQRLSCNPWSNKSTSDNPLSQNDSSLWNRHFCDEELRSVIRQDVVRTFPGVDFFRKSFIQEVMVSILFVYAREHPIMCYRQGMHELLAPVLFVLHCDHQAMLHTDERNILSSTIKEIINPEYIEADGYQLFAALMTAMTSCYHINNVAPTATGYFPITAVNVESPNENKESENEVVTQLNIIRDRLLQSIDPELCQHLKNLDITLPLFGIRWLRLLFGREFPLQDLLVLWDAIFSQGKDIKFIHYIVVSMLVAIRKQLLEGDYTACLMHLMRYPTNVDVMYVIQYALYLQNPQKYEKPVIHTQIISLANTTKSKKINHVSIPVEVPENIQYTVSSPTQVSSINYCDYTQSEHFVSENIEQLSAELNHARTIMSLARLKLLQYHKVLQKSVSNNTDRDAQLALDGIHELCNLLTSRHFSPKRQKHQRQRHIVTAVEPAVEAGEIRPTDLNLTSITSNNKHQHIPRMMVRRDEEMKLFACTEIKAVPRDLPMTDPTSKFVNTSTTNTM